MGAVYFGLKSRSVGVPSRLWVETLRFRVWTLGLKGGFRVQVWGLGCRFRV